jgi:predicted O-methyltransferase YrrM
MGIEMEWATEHEAADFLAALVRMTNRKSVLELGAYKGATAIKLARAGARVVAVDIADRRAEISDLFTFILADSRTFDYGDAKFDFIFFDSDHTRNQLFAEFDHLKRAMTNDCILAFHDSIMFPEVRDFILEQESCRIIQPVTLPTPRGCGLTIATLI